MNHLRRRIKFYKLSPFGLRADRISITDIKEQDVAIFKEALANHGFIVLRNQKVNDKDFVAFLSQLGPLTFTIGETPVSNQPALNIVSNMGRVSPPKSVFHTDTSYVSIPPAFTALRAVVIPSSGGETLFSDQYRAYETLPLSIQEKLAEAQVLHVMSGLALESAGHETQSWHPLFKRHPISGRLALFLSTPERCQEISGIAPEVAHRIIRSLYRHSIRRARLYRHQWQPDDIIIWDNRCTLHRADHSNVVGDRVLHRGMVLDNTIRACDVNIGFKHC